MIDPNLFRDHNEEWEQLAAELNRNEWEHCSRIMTNPETGEVWFPRPWLDALNETPALRPLVAQIKPIEPKDLAPMTPKLRDLAKIFGLPPYKGKAKPNPPPSPEVSAKAAGHRRERCPKCGDWMRPAEVVAWEQNQTSPMDIHNFPKPEDCSGAMVCKGCGYLQ